MIVDSFEQLPETARKPDVAIVGAGAVGIALAVQLARAGLQVTVIEGGPARPPLDYRKANAAGSTGRVHLGLLEGRMKALGGTTRLWGGQLMAFGENDLAAKTYSGKPGWPLAFSELQEATTRALELLKIPSELRDGGAVHRQASGIDPALDPSLELAIAAWLPQPDFARLFAKELHHLPGLFVLTGHRVVDFEIASARHFAGLLLHSPSGKCHSLQPREIVLANGTFELVATLLRLAGRSDSRIDGKAHVGKWFVDHLHVIGGTIRNIDRAKLANLSDSVFHKGHKFTVKFKLSRALQREAGVPNVAAMILAPLGPRELLRDLFGLVRRSRKGTDSPGFFRTLLMLGPLVWRYVVKRRGPNLLENSAFLGIEVEQVACPESRISLNPDNPDQLVLHWALDGAQEMRGIRLFCEAVRDYLVREGLGELEIDPRIRAEDVEFLGDAHDAYHQMGGARMAESAELGVIDANLKVFGTENLYVLGAAAFPSGSFANPTLTALALSVRLAEHLHGLHRT